MHKYKSKQTTPTSYKYIYTISRPPEALTPIRLASNKSCTTKMGRQQQNNSDHTVTIHSSIALLQERFRQLQRVKEMREERELLRFFSESERISPAATHENPSKKLFFHPELIIPPPVVSPPPPPPPVQASFSIQPEPQNKYADNHFLAVDTPLLMSLWPTDRGIVRASNTFDDGDVDTSLHL